MRFLMHAACSTNLTQYSVLEGVVSKPGISMPVTQKTRGNADNVCYVTLHSIITGIIINTYTSFGRFGEIPKFMWELWSINNIVY